MTIRTLTVIATLTLCACAKAPESIAPSYVSPLSYRGYDCSQLAEESVRVSEALMTASEQQRRARANDTLGVIFLGIPVSSLSGGNVASQVGKLKGEEKTIRQVAMEKRCKSGEG